MQSSSGLPSTEMSRLLECPVGLDSLTTAVSLTPCQHNVNESAAKILFGDMKDGACTKPAPCPVCSASVQGYFVDHTLRSIAELMASVDQTSSTRADAPSALDQDRQVRANPPSTQKMVSRELNEKLAYSWKVTRSEIQVSADLDLDCPCFLIPPYCKTKMELYRLNRNAGKACAAFSIDLSRTLTIRSGCGSDWNRFHEKIRQNFGDRAKFEYCKCQVVHMTRPDVLKFFEMLEEYPAIASVDSATADAFLKMV